MAFHMRRGNDRAPWSGRPDSLYWILDSLADDDVVTFEEETTFIRVSSREAGSLVVECDEGAGLSRFPDVDVLAAHQAILSCLHGGADWTSRFGAVQESVGSFGVEAPVDYATTGLSIANAMLDSSKRRRRLGLSGTIPPTVTWDSAPVATGDVWPELAEEGTAVIHVQALNDQVEQGIAISAPGGAVSGAGVTAGPEVVVWPTPDDREFRLSFQSPRQVLRLCNVYRVTGPTWSKVERWTENAGLRIDARTRDERNYHCNHASTSPPSFADLVFTATILPDHGPREPWTPSGVDPALRP